jgi:guanosine-3',5'-bis(diphosphate) 3'-pyrophosphohydrolase
MSNLVEKAKEFAVKAHGDQKYGELPYVVHLQAVANHLKPYGENAEVLGFLHDVVEDTSVSKEEVESEFGKFISECVAILTDEAGSNRKERKAKTYLKMSKVGAELNLALIAKVADRLANLEACVKAGNNSLLSMYKGEHPAFRNAVYREGLCEELWLKVEAIVAA